MLSAERIEQIRQRGRARTACYRQRHPERVREYRMRNAELLKQKNSIYYQENLELCRAKNKIIKEKRRAEILDFFGGRCTKCGFSDRRALHVDHINGGGNKERMAHGRVLTYVILKLISADPDKARMRYQLLCANCNYIKRIERAEHGGPRKYGVLA